MQKYLESFDLPSSEEEGAFLLNDEKLDSYCYSQNNIHPFRFFSDRGLRSFGFEPITLFCGSNGSGKSTLLNLIAQKLELDRPTPFNDTPFMNDYVEMCSFELCEAARLPKASKIIASDDVFDFLLDIRTINSGISDQRARIFKEYCDEVERSMRGERVLLKSIDDYGALKRRREVNSSTVSQYVTRRMRGHELSGKSNGESAYMYFVDQIRENALYLLDEPENSLSPKLQKELAAFLEESVRFYNCQLIISTHSPFLLALRGAKLYDLDERPIRCKRWSEVDNVRAYFELFEKRKDEFLG